MNVGICVPSGVRGEFVNWSPKRAWDRVLEIGILVEKCGFTSLRVLDHFQSVRGDTSAPTFECFLELAGLAAVTKRIRLGPGVACAGFRNPALLAKMIATLDVASGGRAELSVGAGWYEREWRAYGYGFPPLQSRLVLLRETLEIVTRVLGGGIGSWKGSLLTIEDLICNPPGIQRPRVPIIVGGNGQRVVWRLAAQFADELNLDSPTVEQVRAWLPVVRRRCEEVGRAPETLAISAHVWWDRQSRSQRIERLQELSELGLSSIQTSFIDLAAGDDCLYEYAEDCRTAALM